MESKNKFLLAKFGGYHGEDIKKINRYIMRNYGKWSIVFHELTSEYIHTDVYPIPPSETRECYTLVSLGMGTDDMYTDDVSKSAIEVVLYLSNKPVDQDQEQHYINFIVGLTKYPFIYETFFDEGHLLVLSDCDKNPFQYDGFVFRQSRTKAGRSAAKVYLPEIDRTVRFLDLIPVFEEEFDLIRKNTVGFFEWIDKEFGAQGRFADIKRKKYFVDDIL